MGERIAVIGLGRMGRTMAETLAAKGLDITGWTRSGAEADDFTVAATLEEAATGADMLILSLLDDAAVRSVLGMLSALDLAGKLVVETSTVSPAVVRDLAGRIEAAGGRLMDAPVSGGPEMIAAGTAGFLMGGAEADMARLEPVAAHLSNRVLRVGPLGSGAAAKIVNNVALAKTFYAIIDAIRLGDAMGMELDTMLSFLEGSPAMTQMFRARIPKITGEDETVGFTIAAVFKDNALFVETSEAHGVEQPELRRARALLAEAIEAGLAEQDPAALVRFALARPR